ncbi:MAG: protein kinase [Planctomycetota bacterium]
MTTTHIHRCPRCHAAHAVAVRAGTSITCESCGHQWVSRVGSDEYLPGDSSTSLAAVRPLTNRQAPSDVEPQSGNSDFQETEHGVQPPSSTAFKPSTELTDGRIGCPVCGHAFLGQPGVEDQDCPQCHTIFSRATGRLTPGGSANGGDRLIGRALRGCQIDRKLGEGGMGSVYHATQLSLDRSVAIKVLPPELARNRNFIQRFEREAKSLARINHPNILQIYDFGEDVQLGVYFMIIEYVDGWDIGELLRRQPYLSQVESMDIVRQALLGLEQAAEKGVIHRDIKPDNLMLSTSGLCKVSDFGLAKGHHDETEVTTVGVRVGTPAFMSPEQCDGVDVDSRSDVYNLGCTVFLMLTGRLPYDGETPFSIMLKHKVDPIPSVRTFRPDLDQRVDALVQRMMAKNPAHRCRDLRDLIDETEHLLVDLTGTASILRKTNGPIRALIQQSSGRGAVTARTTRVGKRGSDRLRAQPPSTSPVVPTTRGHAPQTNRIPGAATVPEWLRPVDPPTPAPSTASASAQPAVGSRSELARAMGGANAAAKSTVPPPSLQTPFPGAPTPLPETRRASTSTALLPAVLDRVRERGIRAEVAAIAAGAQRLAANGSWEQAGAEWRRASQLARDIVESRRLSDLSFEAAKRAQRRKLIRRTAFVFGTMLLIGINLWIWPPVIHRLLAERERVRIDAISNQPERSRRLREFAAENQGGWLWYRVLFRRGYEVPSATAAATAAEVVPLPDTRGRSASPPRSDAGTSRPKDDLQHAAADPALSWQQVHTLAKQRAAAGDTNAAVLVATAEHQIAAANELRTQLDVAKGQGRHAEALELAQQLLHEHPRAGVLLQDLPLPTQVRVLDGDTGVTITDATIVADGIHVLGGTGRICRSARNEVKLDISARGFAPLRSVIAASPAREVTTLDIRLAPCPLWSIAAPAFKPTWVRLIPAGTGIAVLSPAGVSILDPASGTARSVTLPGMGASPWWSANENGWWFATADGEQRHLPPSLDRTVAVRRLGGAPLALLEVDLFYRAGSRLLVTVESSNDDRALVAREGIKTTWRIAGISGHSEPLLRRADDKIVAIDDQIVRIVEEDGTVSRRLPLRGTRTGPWAELPGNRLLVATTAGIDLVQLGAGGAQIVANAWLAEVGPAIPASASGQVVIARSNRRIDLAEWTGDAFRQRLFASTSGKPAFASVANNVAAIADESGSITLLRLTDGVTLRRFSRGMALATAPLLVADMVIVAEQNGVIAGYRIPTP